MVLWFYQIISSAQLLQLNLNTSQLSNRNIDNQHTLILILKNHNAFLPPLPPPMAWGSPGRRCASPAPPALAALHRAALGAPLHLNLHPITNLLHLGDNGSKDQHVTRHFLQTHTCHSEWEGMVACDAGRHVCVCGGDVYALTAGSGLSFARHWGCAQCTYTLIIHSTLYSCHCMARSLSHPQPLLAPSSPQPNPYKPL